MKYLKVLTSPLFLKNRVYLFFAALAIFLLATHCFADSSSNIDSMQTQLRASSLSTARIVNMVALISGIGFIFSSFYKFNAHKTNPQQVPLAQPLSMLILGSALTVLPYLIPAIVSSTVGGKVASSGNPASAATTDAAAHIVSGGSFGNE
jgi:intracellular multiplication protein IcmD